MYKLRKIWYYFLVSNNTNKEIIYASHGHAATACRQYAESMQFLQEKFGIFESCDDSCCATYIHAKYYDENGNIITYTHF